MYWYKSTFRTYLLGILVLIYIPCQLQDLFQSDKETPSHTNTRKRKTHKPTQRDQTGLTVASHPKVNKNNSDYKYKNGLQYISQSFTKLYLS